MKTLTNFDDIPIKIDTLVCTDLDIPLSLGEYVPKKDEVVAVVNPNSKLIECKIGDNEHPLTQLPSIDL